MAASDEYVQRLVDDPRERLEFEVKNWIEPGTDEGEAKIVKACLAMRNHGGGFLIIGFNNKTYQPEPEPDYDPRTAFDTDKVNALVNRYASERFEVVVHFPTRDGRTFPVLEAERGVEVPVATRRELTTTDSSGATKTLVKRNAFYVRSLEANNTPSTTEAGPQDYRPLVKTCFDNREADIGSFLRRHLGERGGEVERVFSGEGERRNPALEMLDSGRGRFQGLLEQRGRSLPDVGSWEVGACLSPQLGYQDPTQDFLTRLDAVNPRYTGMPLWLDSTGFHDRDSWPYVLDDGWQASIKPESAFWRIETEGNFYLFNPLRDDTRDFLSSPNAPQPGTALELVLMVRDVTHALGVLRAFCERLGTDGEVDEEAVLDVAFRWSGLEGRRLSTWHHPERFFDDPSAVAAQNEVTSTLRLPVDTPESALPGYVQAATGKLFAAFGGQSIPRETIEQISNELLSRR